MQERKIDYFYVFNSFIPQTPREFLQPTIWIAIGK